MNFSPLFGAIGTRGSILNLFVFMVIWTALSQFCVDRLKIFNYWVYGALTPDISDAVG